MVITPHLLALDTSTEVMAVSVLSPAGLFGANLPGGPLASAQLLPAIERQLAAAGVAWRSLDAIAFGRGPGAFTGLRASCAVAQGLAFGLNRPVLPLDSLLVVAEDAFADRAGAPGGLFAVAMDARMDEIYGALYRRDEQGWSEASPAALYTLAAWNARLQALHTHEPHAPLAGAAGSAIGAFGARLTWPAGAPLREREHDRAAALMRLALAAWSAGRAVDAAQALPLYLRDKVALTSAERALGGAAPAAAASSTVGPA